MAGLLLSAGLLTACGDSETSNAGGSGTSEASASGEPITIEVIAPLTGVNGAYQPWVNAVIAATKAANADGGVNGREIEVKTCDAGLSANTSQACGRQAVQDKAAAAVNMTSVATAIEPFLKQAGIPTMDFLVDHVMYESSISYSVASPGPASNTGTSVLAKRLGCTKLVLLRADPASPAEAATYMKAFEANAKEAGVNADAVRVAPGSADMAPYISKALDGGADCLYFNGFGADMAAMLKAAAQADPTGKVKLMTVPAYIPATTLKSLGNKITDRLIAMDFVWPMRNKDQHPGLQTFEDQITKYAPTPNLPDNNSAVMWANTVALITAMKKVKGDVTATAVKAELDKFHDYDPGVAPKVSFDTPNPVKGYTRVFAPFAIQLKYVDGEPEAVGDFFNLHTGESVTDS